METEIEIWNVPPALRIASDFGAIVGSERLPDVLRDIVGSGGAIIAARCGDELRGYATLVPASLPDSFELASIEVSRSSRNHGLGTALLAAVPETLPIDGLALLARGIAVHWETSVAMLSAYDYRGMLMRMLERVGFEHWDTTDPEVTGHALNFLAVRIGERVPAGSRAALASAYRSSG